jgi:hypothetical protein
MSHDDFDFEQVRGLPAKLPEGERLLWQGTPKWQSLAVRAYHVRKVGAYFAILVAWRVSSGLVQGHTASAILTSCALLIGLGLAAMGVLALLAYTNARSTVYSVTNRRILIRHGVAVPLTMNVPFTLINNAALKTFANGTGDIFLSLSRKERVGYVITWPHLRPGRIARPEPSFRALTDAVAAARVLSGALAADAGGEAPRIESDVPATTARARLERFRRLIPGRHPAPVA